MIPTNNNIGAYITGAYHGTVASFTAGTTYDDVLVTTTTGIDRLGFDSCALLVAYSAALVTAKALTIAVNITSCDTVGGSYDTGEVVQAAATAVTGVADATVTGVYKVSVDLSKYKRFVKFGVQPNLTATGTDTATITTIVALGGADKVATAA